MADADLSQDELNALLGGGDIAHKNLGLFNSFMEGTVFNEREQIISAQWKGSAPEVSASVVKVMTLSQFQSSVDENIFQFNQEVSSTHSYEHSFFINSSSASELLDGLLEKNDSSFDVDESNVTFLEEFFNRLSSSLANHFSQVYAQSLSIISRGHQETFRESITLPKSFLVITYEIKFGEKQTSFFEVFDERILELLDTKDSIQESNSKPNAKTYPQKDIKSREASIMNGEKGNMPNVQGVQLPNLSNDNVMYEQGNIGLLMDVPMEVTVELGRAKRLIKDILSMGEGTIISLDKLAGEPIDILVNHKLIAKGEVVVIDENFGVRVTEILSDNGKLLGVSE